MERDIEIELRERQVWPAIVARAGGYPLLVLPLDGSTVVAQGRACHDDFELTKALGWALGLSRRVRLIPVEPRKSEVEFG